MTTFERLLAEMPRIAQAVNGFHDPVAAHRALDALLASLGVTEVALPYDTDETAGPGYPLGTMATLPARADATG
ncbi:MAG TPA: hypothetical protein VNQ77_17050 [Frankiaceae bacterium]|nr:hypothetical protein [Frankiaceae bacterium]